MKKLFYLFAAILFGLTATAQNDAYVKSSMVIIVNQAKATFVKGVSYRDWLTSELGNVKPNDQEEKFLKEVYGYLSSNASSEAILQNFNGLTLRELAKVKDGIAFNESNAKCGFWCSITRFIIGLFIKLP